MLAVTLKGLAARKVRAAMTAVAIVLGVTFVTATFVLTDTSSARFDAQFGSALAGVDLVVRDSATADPGMGLGVERRPVPDAVVDRIRAVPGVRGAAGVALGSAPIVVAGRPVAAETTVGASWAEAPYGTFRIRKGRAPAAPGEVVVDDATATRHGIAVGSPVTVQGGRFTVVGTAGYGTAAGVPDATVALFAPDVARSLFELGDAWSEVQVVADDVPAAELSRRVAAALGTGYAVTTASDVAAASAEAAREQVSFLVVLMVVLAGTALVVGAFLVANAFSIVVAQRTKEFATLRAIGATGRQVRRSVLVEAGAIGLLSSITGLWLGYVAAAALRAIAPEGPTGPLEVRARTIVAAFAVGVGVTLVAALFPARRAARVAPVVAMREGEHTPQRLSAVRVGTGAAACAVGALALVAAASTKALPLVAFGGVTALASVVLLGPLVARRLAAAVPVGRAGVASRLAKVNVHRAARRTAAASGALAVGLAVVTFMTVVATSAKQAVDRGFEEVVTAELVVEDSRDTMMGALSPRVHDIAGEVAGVAAASRVRNGHWQAPGRGGLLSAVDPETFPLVADVDMTAGDLAGLSTGGVVVADDLAAELGLTVGERLEARFAKTGTQSFVVVGLMDADDAWVVGTDYLVSLETFAEHVEAHADAKVFLKLADGADVVAVRDGVRRALAAAYPTATVHDAAEAKAEVIASFDAMLGVVTVLLLLGGMIALLGVTNSLALSVVERTREIGLLRAVGMTRRQVGRMVRVEAALTAAVGGVLGIALGLGLGVATVRALADRVVIDLAVPVPRLLVYLAAAGIGGVLAGVIPGRRAARMDVLSAIASG